MASVEDIHRLLESSQFEEAEQELKALLRESPDDPIVNHLFGCLYEDHRNPRQSRERARRYFATSIAAKQPFKLSFVHLAGLVRNNPSRRLRILRKGAELFPEDPDILWALLRAVPSSEVGAVYETMLQCDFADRSSTLFVAKCLADSGDYREALEPDDPDEQLTRLTAILVANPKTLATPVGLPADDDDLQANLDLWKALIAVKIDQVKQLASADQRAEQLDAPRRKP